MSTSSPKTKRNSPKQQRKQQPKRKAPRQRTKRVRATQFGVLSECAARYACAVGSPFSANAIGACVPSFPARPSYKVHSRITGTFSIGTAGIGYIGVAPCVANDKKCIYYTSSAFSGSSLAVGATGMTSITNGSNPYASSAFVPSSQSTDAMTARIVSIGLRIRYTGTELNRGGLIYGLVHPNHGNLHQTTTDAMSVFRECIRRPVSRSWTQVVASAIDTDEADYPDPSDMMAIGTASSIIQAGLISTFPFSSGNCVTSSNLDLGGIPMAFMVNSSPGNQFEYEIISHLEYIGTQVQNAVTPSHADAVGLSKIIEVKGMADVNAANNTSSIPYEVSFADSLKSGIARMTETTVQAASVAASIATGINKMSNAYNSIPKTNWIEL